MGEALLEGWTGWAENGPLGPDGLVVRYQQAARRARPGEERPQPQPQSQPQLLGAGSLLSELLLCESCGGLLRRDSPLDVIEEIDSYYCPQSLDNLPSSEALLLRNCSAKVFECPDCQNHLSPVGAGGAEAETEAEAGVASGSAAASAAASTAASAAASAAATTAGAPARFYLFCQHCRWDSQSLGLVSRSPDELAAAALARETAHHEGGARLVAALTEHFRGIETKWNSYGLVSSGARETSHPGGGDGGGSDGLSLSGDDVWRWKDCDAAYEARAQAATRGGQRSEPPAVLHDALSALRSEASVVVPRRVSLRTKRSLRCRRCSAANLPNIVCKPQINPLKGDSSMRTNVGAWFKKKSLANDQLPRAVCVRDPASRSLLLALTNPRDSPVTMHFAGLGDVVLDAYDEIEELDVFSGTRPPKALPAREGDDPKLVVQRLCNKVLLRIPEASSVLRALVESSGSGVHAAPSDDAAAGAQPPAPGLDASLRLDLELLITRAPPQHD